MGKIILESLEKDVLFEMESQWLLQAVIKNRPYLSKLSDLDDVSVDIFTKNDIDMIKSDIEILIFRDPIKIEKCRKLLKELNTNERIYFIIFDPFRW